MEIEICELEMNGFFVGIGRILEENELKKEAERYYKEAYYDYLRKGRLGDAALLCVEKLNLPKKAIELYERAGNYFMAGYTCKTVGLNEHAERYFLMDKLSF